MLSSTEIRLTDIVGGRTATLLEKELGLRTLDDLLRHYPRRHIDRGEVTDLAALELGEQVTVQAEVRTVSTRRMRQRKGSITEVIVSDTNRNKLKLTFFNQQWLDKTLLPGTLALFSGKVSDYNGQRQLTSPETRILRKPGVHDDFDEVSQAREIIEEFTGLIPVYKATSKLSNWVISRSVTIALDHVDAIADPLPSDLLIEHELVTLKKALRQIHQPADWRAKAVAVKRLKWDEALALQLVLAQRRARIAENPATPRPARPEGIAAEFDVRLPFELTEGQQDVGDEISAELAQPHPMQRLLQGEVGSGKTVVALRAMLQVVAAGGQAALLAPTEVLAAQHFRTITSMLGDLAEAGRFGAHQHATRVALLTGSLGARARREALSEAASGAAGIVVGTHALLQLEVQFAELGLVVVDEQHRFGVAQRDVLRGKALVPPHVLVMTATPIPRTMAMTVFGDLEQSVLSELPRGRAPISTSVVPAAEKPTWLDRAWQRIREEVAAGHQAFVVCPRIGDGADGAGDTPADSEASGEFVVDEGRLPLDAAGAPKRPAVGVLEVASMLADGPLHGLRLGVLHGRMAPDAKDEAMGAFAAGDLDVLVATTVIEVGVDIPNATVMVVLDADRFGVSQLHQLRGRIGRGSAPGLCLLVTEADEGSPARDRLDAVASTTDGFELAQLDLEQRKEGSVLGAGQAGRSSLRLLSVLKDEDLIAQARAEAIAIVAADPELTEQPALAALVAATVSAEEADFLEKG